MEKIYYDELLNHKVINKERVRAGCGFLIAFIIMIPVANIDLKRMINIAIIFGSIFICSKGYLEKSEIKKLVTFYNDCIRNNKCIVVDNDLKSGFIDISKDIILHKLQIIWEPAFIYNDETQVYKVENTNVIIVDGYFEDDSVKSQSKIHYTLVFVDCQYYMSCIDNMICWEKDKYWAVSYKKKNI